MTRIGITGHREIPLQAWALIAGGIEAELRRRNRGVIGYTSLAEGADQLFAEIILEVGAQLRVVVPCRGYESSFRDDAGRAGFRKLLERAEEVITLDQPEPSREAFQAAGEFVVEACDLLIAVWDGKPARGPGGTGDVVAYARTVGVPVAVIWPEGLSR